MSDSKNIDGDDLKTAALVCGIVMPISAIDGTTESHWEEVFAIFADVITSAGMEPRLVSNANESSLIHQNIVQNLFRNRLVLCDVSGKNPNVMFELGLRLAFDKPTVVVKDDSTAYSFDTSPIQHLPYRRDLRFPDILKFKASLRDKILATLKASEQPEYSTFLKAFGTFKVAKLNEEEVGPNRFILEELKSIRSQMDWAPKGPAVRRGVKSIVEKIVMASFNLSGVNKKERLSLIENLNLLQGLKRLDAPDEHPERLEIEYEDDADGWVPEFVESRVAQAIAFSKIPEARPG